MGYDSISALIDAAFSYKYHQLQDNRTKQQGGTIEFDYLALGLSLAKTGQLHLDFSLIVLLITLLMKHPHGMTALV